jgi:hypothetical protein
MALKEEIGLTSDERHELASFLFSYREGEEGSWKNLTSRELHDLICFLEGYLFISQLLEQRN